MSHASTQDFLCWVWFCVKAWLVIGIPIVITMSQDVNYTFIFAGEFGVGKTSIFKRIQTGKFSDQSSVLLDAVPLSGGSDGELEHYIYRDTLDGINFKVSIIIV